MAAHRTIFVALVLILGVLFARGARAQALTTELVVSGLTEPTLVCPAPNDPERMFVLEQAGVVRVVKNGVLLPTPFLDISSLVLLTYDQGALGLAFHPDYQNNGRFFVNYIDVFEDSHVVEYQVSANPDIADPTPIQTIFFQFQPFGNHNTTMITFGPDGKLYIGNGDGGDANDPGNRAQDLTDNLGKILRLDVDLPAPFIPLDNPFVGVPGNDEIWAYGIRMPWRLSFDMATGDLYIGDVGQDGWEEIDFQPASSTGGENYGWRCMEGFSCTGLTGCTCNDMSLTLPIHDYSLSGSNCSVIGGYVHRSNEIAALQGTYFFADYCSSRIWSFRYDGQTLSDFTERTNELDPPGPDTINGVSSFGQDLDGNVYICDHMDGQIYKIVKDKHPNEVVRDTWRECVLPCATQAFWPTGFPSCASACTLAYLTDMAGSGEPWQARFDPDGPPLAGDEVVVYTDATPVTLGAGRWDDSTSQFLTGQGSVTGAEFFTVSLDDLDAAFDFEAAPWTSIGTGTFNAANDMWELSWAPPFGATPGRGLALRVDFTDAGYGEGRAVGVNAANSIENLPIGSSYCGPANANSTGNPAVAGAQGFEEVSVNLVTLSAGDLPSNQFGYFLNSLTPGFVQNPGNSQGNLCLGGAIGRYNAQVQNTGSTGSFGIQIDLTNTPTPTGTTVITAGQTWNFTAWFRDDNPGPTSNFTDAVSITMQ